MQNCYPGFPSLRVTASSVLLVVVLACHNLADAAFSCKASFIRGNGGTGSIENISIKLHWSEIDITAYPAGGSREAVSEWASRMYTQALEEDKSGKDVTIKINEALLKGKRFDYGSGGTFSNALILSRHAASVPGASCSRRVDNPHNGQVSITLNPKSLKGQYGATLLVCAQSPPRPIIKATVGGEFDCAMPILSDSLYLTPASNAEVIRMAAEGAWLAKDMPAVAMGRRRGLPEGSGPGSGPDPASSNNVSPQCDCTYPNALMYTEGDLCSKTCEARDTEALRFENELRQLELQENVIASFAYGFQVGSPEQRAQLWKELEKDKAEAGKHANQQKTRVNVNQAPPSAMYDAETLRYKAAVESLALPPDVVDDLVKMFHSNADAFRQTLWQRVKENKSKLK